MTAQQITLDSTSRIDTQPSLQISCNHVPADRLPSLHLTDRSLKFHFSNHYTTRPHLVQNLSSQKLIRTP